MIIIKNGFGPKCFFRILQRDERQKHRTGTQHQRTVTQRRPITIGGWKQIEQSYDPLGIPNLARGLKIRESESEVAVLFLSCVGPSGH